MPGVTTAYQSGTHAARPAASAGCILYSCTDHALVYRSDGTAWATWLTLGGTPAAHAASHEDGGSDEIDATGLEGVGGGGGGWALGIDKDGTSFTGCTSESGTWASDATSIQQTTAGASHRRMRFNDKLPIGAGVVMEAEVKIVAVGGGGAGGAGFLIGHPGADGTGAQAIYVRPTANDLQFEDQGIAARRNVAFANDPGVFYTLRVCVSGHLMTAYVDGVLIGTARFVATNPNADYIGLGTFDATADYQDVKVWTLTQP